MKVLIGTVKRPNQLNGNKPVLFAVDSVEYPDPPAGQHLPPNNTVGILILKDTPDKPFNNKEVIYYQDGNNNNNMTFTVTLVYGPCKYRISMTH